MGGVGEQVKWAVVNEEWERGDIVMCITVPDTSILTESNQLIKYSSPSNSQTEIKSNATILFVMQHKLVGHFGGSGLLNKKLFILQSLLHPRALDGVL